MCEKVRSIISFLNSQKFLFYASKGERNAKTFGLPLETLEQEIDLLLADYAKELQDKNLIKYVEIIKAEFNDFRRYKQAINTRKNSISVNDFNSKAHEIFTLPGISMLDLTYLPSFMRCTKLLEKNLDKNISSVAKLVEAYIKLPDYDLLELESSFLEIYEFFKKIEIMQMLAKLQAGKLQLYLADDIQALDETITSADSSDYDEKDIGEAVNLQALQKQCLEKQKSLLEEEVVIENSEIKISEILTEKIELIIAEDNKLVPEHVVYFNYNYFMEQLFEILQGIPAKLELHRIRFFDIVIIIHRSKLESFHKYEQLNDILYDVLLFIFESMLKFLIYYNYKDYISSETWPQLAEYFAPYLSILKLLNSPYNPFARAGLWGNRLNVIAGNSKIRNKALSKIKENEQEAFELPDIMDPSKNSPVYHYTVEEITRLLNLQARGFHNKTAPMKFKQLDAPSLSSVVNIVEMIKEDFLTPLLYPDFVIKHNLKDLFYWSIKIRGFLWAGTAVKLNESITVRVPDGITKILTIINDTNMSDKEKIFKLSQIDFNLVGGSSQSDDTRRCYKNALGLKHQLIGACRLQDSENDLAEKVLNEFIEQHTLRNLIYWSSKVRGLFWAGTLVSYGEAMTCRVPNGIAKIRSIIDRTDINAKAKIIELAEVNYNLLGGRMQSEEARSCYKDAIGLKQQLIGVDPELNSQIDKLGEALLLKFTMVV